jgi:acyl-CoA thioester hydrolase
MYEKRIEIRWRDMDALGHVNHAVFVTYLEEVRDEWLAHFLGATGTVDDFLVGKVSIEYRSPLRQADDAVIVRLRLTGLGRATVHTFEEIHTLSGTLAARAESVLVAVDPATGRSRPLSAEELEALRPQLPDGEASQPDT